MKKEHKNLSFIVLLFGLILFIVFWYHYTEKTEYTPGMVYKKSLGYVYFSYMVDGKKYQSYERIKNTDTYQLYKVNKVYTVIYSKYNYRFAFIRLSINILKSENNIPIYPEDMIIKGINDKK
ncbi:MAG: hypothetical protein EAY69_01420 [Cytophagales bacterium]|nr:MAG: hypothetical protein EAY69_01420 [Cytophagales bacterium]